MSLNVPVGIKALTGAGGAHGEHTCKGHDDGTLQTEVFSPLFPLGMKGKHHKLTTINSETIFEKESKCWWRFYLFTIGMIRQGTQQKRLANNSVCTQNAVHFTQENDEEWCAPHFPSAVAQAYELLPHSSRHDMSCNERYTMLAGTSHVPPCSISSLVTMNLEERSASTFLCCKTKQSTPR